MAVGVMLPKMKWDDAMLRSEGTAFSSDSSNFFFHFSKNEIKPWLPVFQVKRVGC